MVNGIPANHVGAERLDAVVRVMADGAYTCSERATVCSASRPGPLAASFRITSTGNTSPVGYTTPQCGPDVRI